MYSHMCEAEIYLEQVRKVLALMTVERLPDPLRGCVGHLRCQIHVHLHMLDTSHASFGTCTQHAFLKT